ncbi:MAG: carbohydrate kinase family protein [[Clostridium] scindens]
MGKKLLSLGAIAMDIVINSHDLPKDDGFALINHEQMLPGGSASNVSVSAAHFGMESYQTGKIGDDNIGDEFLRTLREDGVDAELVAVKKGGTTLHTYILTAPGGRHCIFANTGDTVCTLIPRTAKRLWTPWTFSIMTCFRQRQRSGWQRRLWNRESRFSTTCSASPRLWKCAAHPGKRSKK